MRLIACATVIGLLLTSAGVAAAAAAPPLYKTGISDTHLRVIDLTPADGVAAGYSIDSFTTRLSGYISYPDRWDTPDQTIDVLGGTAQDLHLTDGGRNAILRTGASAGTMDLSYSVPPSHSSSRRVSMLAQQEVKITLKAHSLLIVDAYAYSGASGWDGLWPVYASMAMRLSGGEGNPKTISSMARHEDGNFNVHKDFQLSYANVSDQDMFLNLSMQAYASVSSVPEPDMGVMLATGLITMGYALRRRRVINGQFAQQGDA